jgi:hypothetical protein
LKDKDNILENYRKQVDELLDNQSDLNLFNSLNQEELDKIWEEISAEMDIDDVWNNISSDLDIVMPVNTGSGIITKLIAIIAAVLIILIGTISVKKAILDSDISQPDILTKTRQNEQSAELIKKNESGNSNLVEHAKGDISTVLRSSSDRIEDSNMATPADMNKTGLVQKTPIHVSNVFVSKVLTASEMADSNLVVSLDKIPIKKSSIPPALFPHDPGNINILSKIDFNSLEINDNSSTAGFSSPLIHRGRISGGIITMFKNTWLFNHETLDGLKSETLTTTEIVFFPDVGLSLNYSLNKAWLIQADGFFYSNTGQEYLAYIYGQYSRKKITLRYSTIALSVKYRFYGRGRFMNRSSVNLLAGGYLSVLHHVNQEINTKLENIESQYKKFDLGIRLGSEIEIPLFYNHFSIAPGLFLSYGIPNIYKGDNIIPGYLIETHNGSAEFHLTFYYHLD